MTDFSSYVTNVPSNADIVFFPSQKPADAQAFASQLAEQGKKAKVFGGDGTNGSGVFKAAGAYLSNFAPDITRHPGRQGDRRRLAEGQPKGKAVGSFGPPTYGATQILLKAIKAACTAGNGTIKKRSAVITDMRKVTIRRTGSSAVSSSGPRSTPRTRRTPSSTSSRSSPTARTSS